MTLENLMDYVNENNIIQLYSAVTFDKIGEYEYHEEIPETCFEAEVTDIFVDSGKLCIEIDIDM